MVVIIIIVKIYKALLFQIEKFKVYASASEYPRGVGISLSFDRLAAVVAEDEQVSPGR